MAKKVTIELEAKTGAADKDIANLKEGIQNLNTAVQETGDGFGSIDSGAKKASKGIKGIGVAIKAAGIGLLLAAFGKLSQIMQENQKVADLFSTTFEVLSIAFNDFANFVVDNYTSITGFFKEKKLLSLQFPQPISRTGKPFFIIPKHSSAKAEGLIGAKFLL